MNEVEKQKIISDLKSFYKKLRNYQIRQNRRAKQKFSEAQDRSLNALRLELQREQGRLSEIISKYGGIGHVSHFDLLTGSHIQYEGFSHSLSSLEMDSGHFKALDGSIGLVNKAIGKLESITIAELEVQEGDLVQEIKHVVAESPLKIFDAMCLHPRVVEASRGLFKDKYYSDAIFRAFTAVSNFVKEKSGLSLDGKALMSAAFNEDKPVIKINDLLTKPDHDEQEGFKFLFMGGQVGIRNPKAHDNVIQADPYRTLEYLSLASLLMKRIEEGKIVKI